MNAADTICALSSPPGPAGAVLVRLSGPDVLSVVKQLGAAMDARPGSYFCSLGIDDLPVPCRINIFLAPHSYTGQDVVELLLPGNPLLAQWVLAALLRRGARLAEAGEFTARAFFNGKMDLTNAEGVAAVIAARDRHHQRAARRLMDGELTAQLRRPLEAVAHTLALLEAEVDFSEEDISFISVDQRRVQVASIIAQLSDLLTRSPRLEPLDRPPALVLAGRPNAGKSTLLNALCGWERAVVSPEAGTTRDVLAVPLLLPRGWAQIEDMAGLESAGGAQAQEPQSSLANGQAPASQAEAARAMQEQAQRRLLEADAIVLVRAWDDWRPAISLPRPADLTVITKCDRGAALDAAAGHLAVSARDGRNMGALRRALDRLAFGHRAADKLALTARHVRAIELALEALQRAQQESATELAAHELRLALDHLGSIGGRVDPDQVLGMIFSQFCVGK